jgi:hypothetical protein
MSIHHQIQCIIWVTEKRQPLYSGLPFQNKGYFLHQDYNEFQ